MERLSPSRGLGPALSPYLDFLPLVCSMELGNLKDRSKAFGTGTAPESARPAVLSGPCPPASRGPRVLTSQGQLQRWRRRAHMSPARRPLPTAPPVVESRPVGGAGSAQGRRRRRGRGRRQRPPDTGEIPPPRPGEARLSVTPAPRVTRPC